MKITIISSGLPKISKVALSILVKQLRICDFPDCNFLGLFWSPGFDQSDAAFLNECFPKNKFYISNLHDFSKFKENFFEFVNPGTKVDHGLSMFLARRYLLDILTSPDNIREANERVYIYTRLDTCLNDVLDMQSIYSDVLKNNKLYIPLGGNWKNGYNDTFAIGSFYSISKYLNIFNYIDDYCIRDSVVFNQELLLRHHLKLNKILVNALPIYNMLFRGETRIFLKPGYPYQDLFEIGYRGPTLPKNDDDL